MSIKIFCDRCKNEMPDKIKDGEGYHSGAGLAYHFDPKNKQGLKIEIDYDLCDICFDLVHLFILGKENKERTNDY